MTTSEFLNGLATDISPEAIEDKATLFHFDLEGSDGGEFTVEIKEGKMIVQEGLIGDAKCVVTGKGKHFIKVVKGEMKPFMALLMGKLKVSDQGEMIRYAKVFGLM